jgi:hypothetical protein
MVAAIHDCREYDQNAYCSWQSALIQEHLKRCRKRTFVRNIFENVSICQRLLCVSRAILWSHCKSNLHEHTRWDNEYRPQHRKGLNGLTVKTSVRQNWYWIICPYWCLKCIEILCLSNGRGSLSQGSIRATIQWIEVQNVLVHKKIPQRCKSVRIKIWRIFFH